MKSFLHHLPIAQLRLHATSLGALALVLTFARMSGSHWS